MYGIRNEDIFQRMWLNHWPLGLYAFWWQWAENPQKLALEYWKASAEMMLSNLEDIDRALQGSSTSIAPTAPPQTLPRQ